ncbi:unnamed protein product [Larinioides sclopetarius]|uniref:Uncharacterized protein n=1 Tax=Larinioides sclopetarius TaxID=280406 RepID=A0AAV2A0P3_9ARAC
MERMEERERMKRTGVTGRCESSIYGIPLHQGFQYSVSDSRFGSRESKG